MARSVSPINSLGSASRPRLRVSPTLAVSRASPAATEKGWAKAARMRSPTSSASTALPASSHTTRNSSPLRCASVSTPRSEAWILWATSRSSASPGEGPWRSLTVVNPSRCMNRTASVVRRRPASIALLEHRAIALPQLLRLRQEQLRVQGADHIFDAQPGHPSGGLVDHYIAAGRVLTYTRPVAPRTRQAARARRAQESSAAAPPPSGEPVKGRSNPHSSSAVRGGIGLLGHQLAGAFLIEVHVGMLLRDVLERRACQVVVVGGLERLATVAVDHAHPVSSLGFPSLSYPASEDASPGLPLLVEQALLERVQEAEGRQDH